MTQLARRATIACRLFGHTRPIWKQYGTPRFIGSDALGTSHYSLEFTCRRCGRSYSAGYFHQTATGRVA